MSAMAIASPRMVKMVTGEEIEMADLGGPASTPRSPAPPILSPATRNTPGSSWPA